MPKRPHRRARDLGIVIGEHPAGRYNAITDVPGVRVGHATVHRGEGPLTRGGGPVRTGVTVIEPRPQVWRDPVFAAPHRLNGNGEMTGLEWIRESGQLTSPIALTNTHSVGVVRDALVAAEVRDRDPADLYWCLPVVAETYDGVLNDINGHHVTADHVDQALASLSAGPPAEGNVGGGTGMICHEFKGGIGTSSRVVPAGRRQYTVGCLVQANYGRRDRLRINGVPVGELIGTDVVPTPITESMLLTPGSGSIIVVLATDAPLLPHQCARLAQRAGLAIARLGGTGEHGSGDLFLAFSTGNAGLPASRYDEVTAAGPREIDLRMVTNEAINPLFDAVIDTTEEAVVNALVAAETMVGRDGITAHALDQDLLARAMSGSAPVSA